MIIKAQHNKKIDKLDFIRIKNLGVSRDTIKKVKKKVHGDRIFGNHLFDRGLITRICKELLQLKRKKTIKHGQRIRMTFLQRTYAGGQ